MNGIASNNSAMPGIKFPRLILASASPRRSDLLSQIGLTFEIFPSGIEEPNLQKYMSPEVTTQHFASLKAKDVAKRFTEGVIIGADTLVSIDDDLLGKPQNCEHAREMLTRLSNRSHFVFTGVCLYNVVDNKELTWSEKTKVFFRELSSTEIVGYINSGEPTDKAGAYGIQGRGAAFVKRIEGCYFNVVGLPLASLVEKLMEIRVDV